MTTHALRGAFLTFDDDPFSVPPEQAMRYESDGLILIEDGTIRAAGSAAELERTLPADATVDRYDGVIMPGFVDTHLHFPQTEMIGAYGEQLLDWLDTYTFPTETKFADEAHSARVAEIFLDELVRNGTTCAMAYSTVHPGSVDALFSAAEKRGMRILTGKTCMDRNAPPALCDTPQRAYDESKALLERWEGRGRASYVITPRFAPTSSPEQLEALGALAAEYPDVAIQTHLSENHGEIAWVKELFPQAKDYTDVYDSYGLLRPRAVLGHGIHLSDRELEVLSERGASIAHCPTSNFFLGSGLFDMARAIDPARPVSVGIGTDVGAGTSFSLLATLREAYKVAQLNHQSLAADKLLYRVTAGNAQVLGLGESIGRIAPGYEADLIVLDPRATPLMAARDATSESLAERLFVLITLGDDRAVQATYVAGVRVHDRDEAPVGVSFESR